MSGEEIRWAFLSDIKVRVVDRGRGTDIWYEKITEIIYGKDRYGKVYVSALLQSRLGNSSTRVRVSDIEFAKKEDEERCQRELNIRGTQAS